MIVGAIGQKFVADARVEHERRGLRHAHVKLAGACRMINKSDVGRFYRCHRSPPMLFAYPEGVCVAIDANITEVDNSKEAYLCWAAIHN